MGLPFFCNICGGPPAFHGLIKRSSWESVYGEDYEDGTFNKDCMYDDYHLDQTKLGYDARLLHPRDIKWLGDIRLVTMKSVDLITGHDTESPVPILSPHADEVSCEYGTFHYPANVTFLHCNEDGFLVHDACRVMLEQVCQLKTSRAMDLSEFWAWLKASFDARNDPSFDWGFGNAFYGHRRKQRFSSDWNEWIPVPGSMWTVLDPEGPFNLKSVIDKASEDTQPSYSFTFSVKGSGQNKTQPKNNLSLLPRELQTAILELLPMPSVLSLAIASPNFQECAQNLPFSFWASQLRTNLPWCADVVFPQVLKSQIKSRVRFDRLFRFLKEALSSSVQQEQGDREDLGLQGLRNRRRIWWNCERIARELEVQRSRVPEPECGNP